MTTPADDPPLADSDTLRQRAEAAFAARGAGAPPAPAALDAEALHPARAALRALMSSFGFASCVPFGRERAGLLFRAAASDAPPDALLLQIEALLGLEGAAVLRYRDPRRGQRRSVRLSGQGEGLRVEALLLGGDTSAESWLKAVLQDEQPAQAYGRLLLLPGAKPPTAVPARGRQVCTCFDVGEAAITQTLLGLHGDDDGRLSALQAKLQCGTNCGSCIPALRRLVRVVPVAVSPASPAAPLPTT